MATDLQPPLHVDNKYAAIVHAFWSRELNDWTPKAKKSQVRAKEHILGMTHIPIPTSCYNPEKKLWHLPRQKRITRTPLMQRGVTFGVPQPWG